MKVDVCFQVWNRPEFTKVVLERVGKMIDWDAVNELYIMDDASEKETREVIKKFCKDYGTIMGEDRPKVWWLSEKFGGSHKSLKRFLELSNADAFIYLSNDLVPLTVGFNAIAKRVLELLPRAVAVHFAIGSWVGETSKDRLIMLGDGFGYFYKETGFNMLAAIRRSAFPTEIPVGRLKVGRWAKESHVPRWLAGAWIGNMLRTKGLIVYPYPKVEFQSVEQFKPELMEFRKQYIKKEWQRI